MKFFYTYSLTLLAALLLCGGVAQAAVKAIVTNSTNDPIYCNFFKTNATGSKVVKPISDTAIVTSSAITKTISSGKSETLSYTTSKGLKKATEYTRLIAAHSGKNLKDYLRNKITPENRKKFIAMKLVPQGIIACTGEITYNISMNGNEIIIEEPDTTNLKCNTLKKTTTQTTASTTSTPEEKARLTSKAGALEEQGAGFKRGSAEVLSRAQAGDL